VITKGSEENAYWDFEANTSDSFLSGGFREQKIGKVEVISSPCSIEAVFRIFRKDIRPLEAEGIWPKNIGGSKNLILQALLRKFIATKMPLVSPVFQIEWSVEP
jgi:hypothetical protein